MEKLSIVFIVLALITALATSVTKTAPSTVEEPPFVVVVQPEDDLPDEQVPLLSFPKWDMSALEDWCGEPVGSIRVAGAICEPPNELVTDDGNRWLVEGVNLEIGEHYLVWFDTMGTDDIAQHEILKIWKEVN